MYFSNNIKLLRQRRQRTQDVVAGELGMSRSTFNSYENGLITNPTVEALIGFSAYFKLSIDTLVKVDLDGLNADDTTLDSLQASLLAIPGITATISGAL